MTVARALVPAASRLVSTLGLSCVLLHAAVDGVVMNRTTGKPQPNATVTLYKLASDIGMDSIETVKSTADGKFVINQTPQGPHLIQAAYDGVTYNHMLPPGRPTTGLTVDVYNASLRQPPKAKITLHMLLIEPGPGEMNINESIVFKNDGDLAYNNPDGGTLLMAIPEGVTEKLMVHATAPQGMPVQRLAEKTATPGVYKVDFPVKPGETRFDFAYKFPFTTPGTFKSKVTHDAKEVRMVAPNGVTLKSDALTPVGQEPRTKATVYQLKEKEFAIQVEGSGALQTPADEPASEEDTGAGLQQIRPRVYDRFYPVLGLAFLILLLGFMLLYRRGLPAQETGPVAPTPAKPPGKGKRRE